MAHEHDSDDEEVEDLRAMVERIAKREGEATPMPTGYIVAWGHLHRYLAEFDFRYSTCKLSDSARMEHMIDQAGGRRLSYEPLTGRQSSTTDPNSGTVGGGANGS